MNFSQRTGWNTALNELSLELERIRSAGAPLLDLSVSNPTRCGFSYLTQDLLEPLRSPDNLIYEPDGRGLKTARQAVQRYYAKKGIALDLNQIFITANTSEAYTFVFRLLFEPGGVLMTPQPSYPLLHYLGQIHDVRMEPYPVVYSGRSWKSDLKKLYGVTPHDPKAILVVNPNNPTGNFIHKEEFAEICLLSKSLGMAILSDEVFFDFVLEERGERCSFAAESGILSFTFGGISKSLGLPQMKLSWIVVSGPEAVRAQAIERLEILNDTYLSACTPVQRAFPVWLEKQESIQKEITDRLKMNLQTLRAVLAETPQVIPLPAEGGWSAVLRLPSDFTDEEWALSLLRKDGVAAHPGYLFDFEEGSHLVVSLLIQPEIFREGIARIAARVKSGNR